MPDPKRRAADYAGIAALVTAVGGVIAMLLGQAHQTERADLVQESVLAVLQYRLGELERRVAASDAKVDELRLELARRPGLGIAPKASRPPLDAVMTVVEVIPTPGTPEAAREALLRDVRAGRSVRVDDIRGWVEQQGRSLAPDDWAISP